MKNSLNGFYKLGFLFFAPISFNFCPSVSQANIAQAADANLGRVVQIQGKAWVKEVSSSPDAKEKKELRVGSPFHMGDIITTDSDTQLQIVLGEQEAALWVKPNTTVTLTRTPEKIWTLEIQKGMLVSHVRPQPARSKHFQVRTKAAVFGVRGTTFFIKQETEKEVFLCTCSGIVTIDDQVLVVGKHHDSPRWIKTGSEKISARLRKGEKGDDHGDADEAALSKWLVGWESH